MRLFLCSSTVRGEVVELTDLVGAGARVALTANALDSDERLRAEWLEQERSALCAAGLEPTELDLRRHFCDCDSLARELDTVDMVWATGGSVFLLIDAMRRSGLDRVLTARVRDGTLAYGGASAGACVCGPTLHGFDLIEDDLPAGGPAWDGLGLVPFSIAPHSGADGAAGAAIVRLVRYFRANAIPYRALRDGEAIVVRGHDVRKITLKDR